MQAKLGETSVPYGSAMQKNNLSDMKILSFLIISHVTASERVVECWIKSSVSSRCGAGKCSNSEGDGNDRGDSFHPHNDRPWDRGNERSRIWLRFGSCPSARTCQETIEISND